MLLALLMPLPVTAEVLQSISDDSVNVSVESQPGVETDRHFNYRVICSPEEKLDDCEPATLPGEPDEGKPKMVIPVPDFPPEADNADEDQPVVAQASVKPSRKPPKSRSKKASGKAVKKTAKKPGKQPVKKASKKPARK